MTVFGGWRGTFSSLENREYRWYWLSATAAAAVMQMNLLARGWLVYDLTGSAEDLGWVSFAAGVPLLLLSPFGGAITDRLEKRNLIIFSQMLMAATILCIAVLISIDRIVLWHLIAAAVVNGILLSLNIPSRQAIVPQLVEGRQVMNAVALNSGSQNLNRVIAPALAGVLIGLIGMAGVYFVMVFFALVSALLMFAIPVVGAPTSTARATLGGDILAGLDYVRQSPPLRQLLLMAIIPIMFGMPYMMLLPVFASDVLDTGSTGLGYLMAATGVGAVIGSILIASLSEYRRKGILLIASSVLFGLFLVMFAYSEEFYLSLFFLLGVGMGNAGYLALNNSLLLLNSEDKMHGRVMSLYMMSIGIFPIAVLPAGVLIDSFSPSVVVCAGGAIIVVFTMMMAVSRPVLRRL